MHILMRFVPFLLLVWSVPSGAAGQSSALAGKNVLVYTRNGEGFVHDNVAVSAQAIADLGKKFGFAVDVSDEAAVFTEEKLKKYHFVVFANTNNEVFDNDQQRLAFRRFIQAGGGMVGIHSALGTERDWAWFNQLKGGSFTWHPKKQDLYLTRIVRHESTEGTPADWEWSDECYFSKTYYPGIRTLMVAHLDRLDPADQKAAREHRTSFDNLHPVVWHQGFDGGVMWMTTLGHDKEAYTDPVFLTHLTGGLEYVASQVTELDYAKAYARDFDEGVRFGKK